MEGFNSHKESLQAAVQCLDQVLGILGDRDRPSKRSRLSEAPPGLEKPFQDLYTLLYPCLVERKPSTNAAAFVMGMRGTGKSLLVERCLHRLQQQQQTKSTPTKRDFRVIRLHGTLMRANDVTFAVKEIIRQFSDIALEDKPRDHNNASDAPPSPRRVKSRKKLLRMRQNSSFTSNLSLLDSVLKLAFVDGIPIVIVLEELDLFLGETSSSAVLSSLDGSSSNLMSEGAMADRQLLLYHLLDRVTTHSSLLCLIGITSHLQTIGMLEKRVKSRADGASKIVYVRPYDSYESLMKIIMYKLKEGEGAGEMASVWKRLDNSVRKMFLESEQGQENVIRSTLERQYRLGKDVRWFVRVLSCALSLYREDCQELLRKLNKNLVAPPAAPPELTPQHVRQALTAMGAPLENDPLDIFSVDPRLQALLDLSGPQVALVLAARRILARDEHNEEVIKPLTFDRMVNEYESSYRAHGDRHSRRILQHSLLQLLEMDVLKPSADHTGGCPLQYEHHQTYYNLDSTTLSRLPLHLPIEVNQELGTALQNGKLDCSTTLRAWGKQKN